MRPTILKVLNQEPVTKAEWQDLFFSVHLVCVWNDKDISKLQDALKEDIMDFIKQAQQVLNILLRYTNLLRVTRNGEKENVVLYTL